MNREVADLLARALADACAANDPAAAALAAYRVFTTPDVLDASWNNIGRSLSFAAVAYVAVAWFGPVSP